MTFIFRDIPDEAGAVGASLLTGGFELPRLVLKRSALEHNIEAMGEFCASRGVSLAPHAKTTMAPSIIRRQIEGGAWAMTVATMQQLRVCAEAGASRILLANELVNPLAAQWLGQELIARGPALEVFSLVDSAAGVALLSEGLRASGLDRPFPVLLEMGVGGGRAGTRSIDEAVAVARSVARHPALKLVGVEGFEGILGTTRSGDVLAKVDGFLNTVVRLARRLEAEGYLSGVTEVVLSAGGSSYFDRVASVFGAAGLASPTRVVLRSGCYITHHHAGYGGPAPLTGLPDDPGLVPALELWSEIQSVPEPGRAIAGFGRRDAPFDAGLPVVLYRIARGHSGPPAGVAGAVTALNDQHAYIDATGAPELEVGDRLICGIVHPCTAFDKWRRLPMVDDEYRVVEIIDTYF